MQMKKIQKSLIATTLAGIMISGSSLSVLAANKPASKIIGHGKEVKNVIVLISDGWGYNQILATNYYTEGFGKAQIYENFPTKVAMSTYSTGGIGSSDDLKSLYNPKTIWNSFDLMKNNPTDSAAAGTAMSTGTKTYDAAIGVDEQGENLKHIVDNFEAKGKATGVISSVEFSHATPASFVAHNASRNSYSEIANEMMKNSATDLIMGAGNPLYDDNGNQKSTPNYKYVGGVDTWNALVDGTLDVSDANGDGTADAWTLIQTKEEFETLTTGDTADRLIGVPMVHTTLQQGRDGDRNAEAYEVPANDTVPTLATMTSGALNVLDNDENGFFLMVEGGAIDWAGHANQSGRLIEEQAAFNDAVEATCRWVEENSSWSETLVIVTGDHETGYLTGTEGVYDEVVNQGASVMPIMTWNSGDHTNQLIPFFAKGKGAEIFKKMANEFDPVRGNYMDNTEMSEVIRALID
jgi:alkaline phosphatase